MKARDLAQFVMGTTEEFDVVVEIEVLGHIVVKRVTYATLDANNRKLVLKPERVELK